MNSMNSSNSYQKAQKRVEEEKGFYRHLTVYLIINVIISLFIVSQRDNFYDKYMIWNLISTPVIWGVFLFFHWVTAFKKFKKVTGLSGIKKWEEQKIKELMNDEDF